MSNEIENFYVNTRISGTRAFDLRDPSNSSEKMRSSNITMEIDGCTQQTKPYQHTFLRRPLFLFSLTLALAIS
jgi:hypothetical protein